MDVFTIGEYVSLLKEEGKFKILSLQRDIAIIEDEYGFERTITLKELVKRREIPLPTNFQVKDSTQEQKTKAKNTSELPLIDLHMEMLEVPTNNMNTHDILLHQIHVFKKFTNKCSIYIEIYYFIKLAFFISFKFVFFIRFKLIY